MNLLQKAALDRARVALEILDPGSGEAFRGQRYIQLVKAAAVARLDGLEVDAVVKHMYGPVAAGLILKAADPSTRADIPVAPGVQDFVEVLQASSLTGQLAFTRIAPSLPVAVETSAPSAAFVGEGLQAAESKWAVTTLSLPPCKVVSLAPLTFESVRDNSVQSDQLVQSRMIRAIGAHETAIMFGTAAASGTAQPAGLLNGVTPVVTSGVDPEDLVADIKGMLARIPADLVGDVTLVMHPLLAFAAGSCRNALGAAIFPGLTAKGGVLEGLPVATSSGISATRLIALVPHEIHVVGDDSIDISLTTNAVIDGTSLFEHGLAAFRAIRSVNWAYRRPNVVQFVDSVVYGPTPSATAT